MKKQFTIITIGKVLREIEEEGKEKGQNWKIPRLYVTRNEKSEKNINEKLTRLNQKEIDNSSPKRWTSQEVEAMFLFPIYSNMEGHWRVYSPEEAADLKEKIKEARRYTK